MRTKEGYVVDRVIFDHSPLTAAEGNPFKLTGTMSAKVADVVVTNPDPKQGAAYRIGGLTVGQDEYAMGTLYLPFYNIPRYEFGFSFKLPYLDADFLKLHFKVYFDDGVNLRLFEFVAYSNYDVANTYQYLNSAGVLTNISAFDPLWRVSQMWYDFRVVGNFSEETWEVIELNDLRLSNYPLQKTGVGASPYLSFSGSIYVKATTTVHFYLDRLYIYALR